MLVLFVCHSRGSETLSPCLDTLHAVPAPGTLALTGFKRHHDRMAAAGALVRCDLFSVFVFAHALSSPLAESRG